MRGELGRAVDLPLLLAALGVDPDLAGQIVERAVPLLDRAVTRVGGA
ncbi:hypothetical protein ACI8AF_24645 [Blastococcus sp. SYSU D00669]